MKKINNFDVPENWSEVEFGTYNKLFIGVEELDSQEEKSIKIISNILGISFDDVLDLKSSEVQLIINCLGFLSNTISDEYNATITLGTKVYKVLKLDKMSYRQYISVENESKEPNNMLKFVATLLVDAETEKYDPEDIEIIGGLLSKKPVTEVYPLINYFGQLKND